ncbi:unnamed protein product [Cuscuta europaea]|uniref:Uncharacterized protein n=1 Tax=Cuscuta europaea TaxID=41803 RepID=A0A9P1E5X5_CUSEU|nr:unnamed protein product [Cuscuta europaea]
MALTGNNILCKIPAGILRTRFPLCHTFVISISSIPPWPNGRRHITVPAAGKVSTGKIGSKSRTSSLSTKEPIKEDEEKPGRISFGTDNDAQENSISSADDVPGMPELPGREPDFWEGPQWDAFGFFIQYMWAFGIVFALVACVVAVATYNDGATDFKDTPAYKESVESRELLEGPDSSKADVFESNPTDEAPSLAE